MKYHDDFQLEERIALNVQRKRRRLRWGLFGINLAGFLLYVGFVLFSTSEGAYNFYQGLPFRSVIPEWAHVLWIPMVLWGFALLIQLVSGLMESGLLDRVLTALAREQEEKIIDTVLQRVAQAEKRKRDTSRLDDHEVAQDDGLLLHRIDEEQAARGS